MFTGIVQSTGVVADVRKHAGGVRLSIETKPLAGHPKTGDSFCVSGVCLTVAAISGNRLEFDVVAETLAKSTLRDLQRGRLVNLEQALRVGDRLDGHFVQGHIDGMATVECVTFNAAEHLVWLHPEGHLLPCIIPKGSLALDGVSLTVAALKNDSFSVALVPTTLQRTTLGALRAGDRVNIESDIMVRTMIHYLRQVKAGEAFQDKSHAPRFDSSDLVPPPDERRPASLHQAILKSIDMQWGAP